MNLRYSIDNTHPVQVAGRMQQPCNVVESADHHAAVVEALPADPSLLDQNYFPAVKAEVDSCRPPGRPAAEDDDPVIGQRISTPSSMGCDRISPVNALISTIFFPLTCQTGT
jgi:hypothetical protein